MYQDYQIEEWQEHSYTIAEKFLSQTVANDWKEFLKEFDNA